MPKILVPLCSTTVLYLLYYLISTLKFGVQILAASIPYDFGLQLVIAYAVFALSRQTWIFLIIHTLVMGGLYVGNAVKISFFGGPIMPDDAFALQSLLLILEGWRFFAVAITCAGIVSLLLFNFKMRYGVSYLASVAIMLLGLTVIYKPSAILQPLDDYFGNSVWDQRSNYVWRGATLYSLLETCRYFAVADTVPDADKAQHAAENLLLAQHSQPAHLMQSFSPRNVHIVLLESFWDPNALKNVHFKTNPLAPEFAELWKSAGHSQALAPVFGGFTANSEFEVLCGFPVSKDNVKFERQLLNDVPCLPAILAEQGYLTIASHPNVPVFWNRVNAYQRIGFQTYWSVQDFVLDDMNREFLADSSLYRQVTDKISSTLDAKQPVLDYIVTYFGHWDYPLNESRPEKVASNSAVEDVDHYANTIYYKSRELMDFINDMRQRDPDGIIVVFGDHLPFLGENFAGYVESGVLPTNKSEFTAEMFKFYVSTPMIIINGQQGPVQIGQLPLYKVPKLILDLLNYHEPTIMDYTENLLTEQRVRPLPGLHFNIDPETGIELCKEPPYSNDCHLSAQWLETVSIVANDLFIGKQFTRPRFSPKQPRGPWAPPEQIAARGSDIDMMMFE